MRCLSRRWRPWSGLFATRLQVSPQPVHMFPTICGFSGNTLDAVIAVFKTSCCRSKVSRSHRRQGSSLGIWPTREKHVSLSSVAGVVCILGLLPHPIFLDLGVTRRQFISAPWVPLQYPMNTNKLLLLPFLLLLHWAIRHNSRARAFGLWRVCFPPCLVRPGRRLPVQGLSEGSRGCLDRLPA